MFATAYLQMKHLLGSKSLYQDYIYILFEYKPFWQIILLQINESLINTQKH